ncbi:hypothetical protein BZF66_06685 [Salmonella enterica]|uniref:hypothetical protein n=1 Tax=Salmonella enterica TaxID=28901 RepID=UPI0013829E43|nr:hypothetical protein [Salmonella enterica]ECV9084117.1 hypothetical protein [Salmonella enterica subsp. enterica serovar Infantis]MCP0435782.1 hypothetical protein [Salmonella enterica subsp. enterica serovar Mbandaka]EHX8550433.1 hypothetical protein [Salmonella enterica]ELL7856575.1 hypothetical protein [Salmonella enterica]
MTAKELAELLLQTPDLEVYTEECHVPDFSDAYYSVEKVIGITKTPDGIFINNEYISGKEPRSPSQKPQIGSVRIMLKDGQWFRQGNDGLSVHNLHDFIEYGFFITYGGWNSENWLMYDESRVDDYISSKIEDTETEPYSSIEVQYIEILTEVHSDTWHETWQKFSFGEALEFVKARII